MIAKPPRAALHLPDETATLALGACLAGRLQAGDCVFLEGDLGAGKTTLARGFIRAWTGLEEDAPSPTYTLVQTYEGPRGALWHADLYRLTAPEEALELGLEEAFGAALTLIEWPDRLGPFAPADRLAISLTPEGPGRAARIAGRGRFAGWTP